MPKTMTYNREELACAFHQYASAKVNYDRMADRACRTQEDWKDTKAYAARWAELDTLDLAVTGAKSQLDMIVNSMAQDRQLEFNATTLHAVLLELDIININLAAIPSCMRSVTEPDEIRDADETDA